MTVANNTSLCSTSLFVSWIHPGRLGWNLPYEHTTDRIHPSNQASPVTQFQQTLTKQTMNQADHITEIFAKKTFRPTFGQPFESNLFLVGFSRPLPQSECLSCKECLKRISSSPTSHWLSKKTFLVPWSLVMNQLTYIGLIHFTRSACHQREIILFGGCYGKNVIGLVGPVKSSQSVKIL